MQKNYIKGKDGYVEFFIEERNWADLADVDSEFAKIVNSKNITKEFLLNSELTDILRAAYYNDFLKEKLSKMMSLRPLPIRSRMRDTGEKIKLFPHQIKAISFMKEREALNPILVHGLQGGIIRLEMGLGKTLTAIAYSLMTPRPSAPEECGKNGFPTLIIASKTVVTEWKKNGFEKFFNMKKVKVLYLHDSYIGKNISEIDRATIVRYDFVVTTYDVCLSVCKKGNYHEDVTIIGNEHTLLKDKVIGINNRSRQQSDRPKSTGYDVIYTTPWERVFLDESQKIANPDTWSYKAIMAVYGKYKWCLTGTPVKNYDTDIWAQFRFCGYNGVDKKLVWSRNYMEFFTKHKLGKAILSIDYGETNISLPDKVEKSKNVVLSSIENMCYDVVQRKTIETFEKVFEGDGDFASVLALFTRLRQCCIAPYLITSESKREKNPKNIKDEKSAINILLKDISSTDGKMKEWIHDKNGTAGIQSSKMKEIMSVLSAIDPSEKILIFSNFTSVLDLLAYAIRKNFSDDFNFEQIDGDTKITEREEILEKFKDPKENIRCLLMTYKVGSEGLNLIEANHVICIEPWWTPSVPRQAVSRCYRTGQEKSVYVYNILVTGSIEEKVLKVSKGKENLSDEILKETKNIDLNSFKLDKLTLGKILGIYT